MGIKVDLVWESGVRRDIGSAVGYRSNYIADPAPVVRRGRGDVPTLLDHHHHLHLPLDHIPDLFYPQIPQHNQYLPP